MDVNAIAKLSRLQLSPEEAERFQKQLSSVFKYFEEIKSVDTAGVEPLVTPSEIEFVFRADHREVCQTVDEALSNAPERVGNLFKVPPVV